MNGVWKDRRIVAVAAGAIATIAVAAAGCSDDPDPTSGSSSSALPQGAEHVELDPTEFTTAIDNSYWPMAVGSRWIYSETDAEGARRRVVVTVTPRTKTIANGVEARVVHDVVIENGKPAEITDDWYAQDSTGNVWYLGEDTTEYENGKPVSKAGSFEAGVDGAEPGVIMPAEPAEGMTYRQEYYSGEAEDQGEIIRLGEQVEVPAGHYTGVLMTKDFNPLEPKVLEFKFFAKGVGPVLSISLSGSNDREELLRFDTGS